MPVELRIFLTSAVIVDDIGVIAVEVARLFRHSPCNRNKGRAPSVHTDAPPTDLAALMTQASMIIAADRVTGVRF